MTKYLTDSKLIKELENVSFVKYLENHTGFEDIPDKYMERFADPNFDWQNHNDKDIQYLKKKMNRKGYLVMEYIEGYTVKTLIDADFNFQFLVKKYFEIQKENAQRTEATDSIQWWANNGLKVKTISAQRHEILSHMSSNYVHPEMTSNEIENQRTNNIMDALDIRKVQSFFSFGDRKEIVKQAVQMLYIMMEAGVIHRDFRVHNLIYNPATKKLTLLDFGTVIEAKPQFQDCVNQCFRTQSESKSYWIPPETRLNKSGNDICNFPALNPYAFDMFSLGMMVLELSLGRKPAYNEMFKRVLKTTDYTEQKMIEDLIVDEAELHNSVNVSKKVLLAMVSPIPDERPHALRLLQEVLSKEENIQRNEMLCCGSAMRD